jgi:hypothetical protein
VFGVRAERDIPYCIGVDVGRSSVKVVQDNNANTTHYISFPSIFSMTQSQHSQVAMVKETGEIHEATVNGKYWLMGETARKRGDYIIEPTEGDSLKEVSVAVCLYVIGRACRQNNIGYGKKVHLGINLTYENFFMREEYRKALVGKHKVILHEDGEVVEFEITKCFVLYQGYTSMLSVAMDKDYRVKPLYAEGVGLVVDIGRKTVDVSFIDSLMVKDGKSFDFGTMKVFENVSAQLRDNYKVVKQLYEIEQYFIKNNSIRTLEGKDIKVSSNVSAAVKELYPQLEFILKGFFESRTPDYLLLTGGGAELFEGLMKEKYPMTERVYNSMYGNAEGLHKFLARIREETK